METIYPHRMSTNTTIKYNLVYSLAWALLLLLVAPVAHGQDYKGSLSVETTDFSERNDSLYVSFEIRIDSRAVPTCSSIMYTPEIRSDKNTVYLPYVQINGSVRGDLNRRWFAVCSEGWLSGYQAPEILVEVNKYTDERMTYSVAIPYQGWMQPVSIFARK